MLAAVTRLVRAHGMPCDLSLEAPMACGFGVCLGCVVPCHAPEGGDALRAGVRRGADPARGAPGVVTDLSVDVGAAAPQEPRAHGLGHLRLRPGVPSLPGPVGTGRPGHQGPVAQAAARGGAPAHRRDTVRDAERHRPPERGGGCLHRREAPRAARPRHGRRGQRLRRDRGRVRGGLRQARRRTGRGGRGAERLLPQRRVRRDGVRQGPGGPGRGHARLPGAPRACRCGSSSPPT